jgi:hypothetical protein
MDTGAGREREARALCGALASSVAAQHAEEVRQVQLVARLSDPHDLRIPYEKTATHTLPAHTTFVSH